jgi:protein-disulfide isomerase
LVTALEVTASLALIAASGVVLWPAIRPRPVPAPHPAVGQAVTLAGRPAKGDLGSPVGVVEFSDFQCPYCAQFVESVLPELNEAYLSRARAFLVFRHLPLVRTHPHALAAARAASCAHEVGQFWPLHDGLFKNARSLNADMIADIGTELGLGPPWRRCLNGDRKDVSEDITDAKTLQIRSTPSFLVGHRMSASSLRVVAVIEGARPFKVLSKAIDDASGR